MCVVVCCVFFFKQKTAYEMRISDWSSDVCSSDLRLVEVRLHQKFVQNGHSIASRGKRAGRPVGVGLDRDNGSKPEGGAGCIDLRPPVAARAEKKERMLTDLGRGDGGVTREGMNLRHGAYRGARNNQIGRAACRE